MSINRKKLRQLPVGVPFTLVRTGETYTKDQYESYGNVWCIPLKGKKKVLISEQCHVIPLNILNQ